MIFENKVPGYLGTTIIAPGGNNSSVRYIINRFSDKVTMDAWESSAEALKLIEEANNYSTIHYTSAMSLETWFSVPDLKAIVPPPIWKMAIVAFIGAFCVSSIALMLLRCHHHKNLHKALHLVSKDISFHYLMSSC